MKPRIRPVLVLFLKLVLSAALVGFLLTRIDLARVAHTLVSADIAFVAGVLGVYLVAQLLSAVRWTCLARAVGFQTPLKDMIAYYFIGMFFNLFAPSTVGGDVSRVYYLARDERAENGAWPSTALHAAIAVLADRAIGMIVLIWVGAAGLALFPQFPVPAGLRLLTFGLAAGLAAGSLLVPFVGRALPPTRRPLLMKIRVAATSFRNQRTAIALALLLSLAIHVIQSAMHVWLGRALALEIPLSFCFILYPLVGAFAALPITFNGIGLREGGYLFLLGVLGVASEKAIAFGLLLFIVVALDSLLGGIAFVIKKSPRSEAIPAGNIT